MKIYEKMKKKTKKQRRRSSEMKAVKHSLLQDSRLIQRPPTMIQSMTSAESAFPNQEKAGNTPAKYPEVAAR